MATKAQIEANRKNARKSTGPKDTDLTRFNGLTHGLCAGQVVIPGECRDEFDAWRNAWFGDWRPMTHTRAVLVERAAVASWRLRRAVRSEAARLYDVAADVAHEFERGCRDVVDGALHLLPRDPAAALARFRTHAAGLDCLIGLWDELAEAAGSGWTSRQDHHDRLLNLLGHPAGSDPKDPEAARASLTLLRGDGPDSAGAAAVIRGLCAERSAELRRERSAYWDPAAYRRHLIDAAVAPTSKEAQLMHRYEMAHEKSLRSAIRQLLALEKSGADLPDEPGPEPGPPAGPERGDESISSQFTHDVCDELASVGAAATAPASPPDPTPAWGPPEAAPAPADGPGRPIEAVSGPARAPRRT